MRTGSIMNANEHFVIQKWEEYIERSFNKNRKIKKNCSNCDAEKALELYRYLRWIRSSNNGIESKVEEWIRCLCCRNCGLLDIWNKGDFTGKRLEHEH